MKKIVTKIVCAVLACAAALSMAACGSGVIGATNQLAALQEVALGTSDVAFVDYTLAMSKCGKGSFENLIMVEGIELSKEEFAVGIRKEDTALKAGIDAALVKLYKDGTMAAKRAEFGEDSIALIDLSAKEQGAIDSTIGAGKTLKVGITDYEPMDFKREGSEEWTGFDAEMARLVAAELGYTGVEFVEIVWEVKITELQSQKIDVIWNGMTVTDELGKEMAFSYSYATNSQVAVIRKADVAKYKTLDDMKGAKIIAEGGSAGEDAAKEIFG